MSLLFHILLFEFSRKYDKLRKKKDEIAEKLQNCKRKTVTVQADTAQSNKKKKNLEHLLEQERGKLIELELVRLFNCYVLLS